MFREVLVGKRQLVVSRGSDVKTYSLSTGELLNSFTCHDGDITSMFFAPWNHSQLMTVSPVDNTLRIWNFSEGRMLRQSVLQEGELNLLRFVPLVDETLFGLVAKNSKDPQVKENWKIVVLSDKNKELKAGKVILKSKGAACRHIAAGGKDSRYFAAVTSCTLLWYDNQNSEVTKKIHSHRLTTVAIHPTQDCVATGDEEGKIIIWRRNTCSIMHWHAHPVSSIAFTTDGIYLLSGGEESVLVMWQLDTSKKTFLPRLGGPLTYIATNKDSSLYAIITSLNALKVIDARTVQIQFVISSFPQKRDANHQFYPFMVSDCVTDYLIIPYGSGSIQFYDIDKDKSQSHLDVCQRNYVSRTDKEKHIITKVRIVAASRASLATVEQRKDDITLKFWSRDYSTFTLLTIATRAHAKSISSLQFDPDEKILVSGSLDGYFKFWEYDSKGKAWFCSAVCFYRNLPIYDCKYSSDGHVLAVAEGRTVTLWQTNNIKLIERLSHPLSPKGVKQVEFYSEYLLAALIPELCLFVWDLRKISVLWKIQMPIHSIATFYDKLAISTSNRIMLFEGDQVLPIATTEVQKKPVNLLFQRKSGQLVYLSASGTISHVFKTDNNDRPLGQDPTNIDTEPKKLLDIQSMQKTELDSNTRNLERDAGHRLVKLLSSHSSHLLPPMSKMYDSLIQLEADSLQTEQDCFLNEKKLQPKKTILDQQPPLKKPKTRTNSQLGEHDGGMKEEAGINKEEFAAFFREAYGKVV